jgi:hypothetical protein
MANSGIQPGGDNPIDLLRTYMSLLVDSFAAYMQPEAESKQHAAEQIEYGTAGIFGQDKTSPAIPTAAKQTHSAAPRFGGLNNKILSRTVYSSIINPPTRLLFSEIATIQAADTANTPAMRYRRLSTSFINPLVFNVSP